MSLATENPGVQTADPIAPKLTVGCHNCGSASLQLAIGYGELHRVSSDCRPSAPGGQLARCPECDLVQAVIDEQWQQEAREIYRAYSIYHQSGGIEQPVFDATTGERRSRSEVMLPRLQEAAALPPTGRLLDIGCGNGSFLRACSQGLKGWTFCGSEFDTRHRAEVEDIPGVHKLYTGSLDEIPGNFDVITLIHVLEHITGPTEFLKQVAPKLAPDGWLFIEVPDCSVNPFMLLVADHCSHFSPSSLSAVVRAAGFEIVRVGPGWVPKEISLVARRTRRPLESNQIFGHANFLHTVATEAALLAQRGVFGIFGTSIGATWLDAQLDRIPQFFVDEDWNRAGKTLADRPILAVSDIPAGATVYIALSPAIAAAVALRLRAARKDVTFVEPGQPVF